MNQNYYLKTELYEMIQKDSTIFDFLETNSLDGVWYWDMENPQNEWLSPRFWEVLGYKAEEKKHLVSEWQELIFPEDLEKTIENFNKHYEDPNHPYDQIVRYKHKLGHTVWIRCRGSILRDENGKPIRMIGVHNDVSVQKNSEENLLKRTNQLKAILDSSLSGIMALDNFYDENGEIVDFIIVMSNKEACRIANFSEEQLLGKRLSEVLSGNFKPLDSLGGKTLFDIYKEVVLTGESKSLEFYFEGDGIKDWFRNKAVKYNDGFVCTFEVITQEKHFQEKLEQKVKEEVEKTT
jgi:PAS domain S-box-containing protein